MNLETQLEEALREVRRDNAHRMNRMRAIGTGLFVVIAAIATFGYRPFHDRDDPTWIIIFCGSSAYFPISVFLYYGSKTWVKLRQLSCFAVPLLDIPVLVAIQATAIVHSSANPGHSSEFTISVLVCCIILSTFTLDLRQVGITVAVAVVGEQILQHLAGISLGGRLASIAVFGIVTWICVFAKRSRVEMVSSITRANARRARLQRYFSPGVGELIEKHDEDEMAQGQECELTIIFTDIRGFTRISENLSGPDTISFLNHYHARMVEAVFQHGGTLDKYLGDGLMIYFNAPVTQTDHACRAIRCALQMQREVASLNTHQSLQSEDQLRIGIGIHSGRAILGDIGAPHRLEFTAIGDAVNVAARLQELTKELGHDILVSRATASLVDEDCNWTRLGDIPLRNRNETIEIMTPCTPLFSGEEKPTGNS